MSEADAQVPTFRLRDLPFDPGVFADLTPKAAVNKYINSNKVRFFNRYPQTMGGTTKYNAAITWGGIPRVLKTWATLAGTRVLACGSNTRMEIEIAGVKTDITPLRYLATGTLGANPFTTTSGSALVSVAHTAHGRAAGDTVDYPNATTLDDVDLSASAWTIASITDADNYVITATTASAATAAGGGSGVEYRYSSVLLALNPIATINGSAVVTVTHVGHGLTTGSTATLSGLTSINSVVANGTWVVTSTPTADTYTFTYTGLASGTGPGGGALGRAEYVINIGDASGVNMRLPSIAPWGEDALFTMGRDSYVYLWDATNPTARARVVPRAPTCHFIVVSPEDMSLIAYGANGDDLAVAWSDQEDYTNWAATSTTTADERRILRGSIFVAAVAIPGGILVWTDTALHIMAFIGGDFVFSITFIGKTSICGQNAAIEHDGVAYWMGGGTFWVYDGRMRAMPCFCKKRVFDDINLTEQRGVMAGTNIDFNEVWFFYATAGETYNDAYLVYNDEEDCHYPGYWPRTAWLDDELLSNPLGASSAGILYQHEDGTADDDVPLDAMLESGEIEPMDGMIVHCQRIVLDAEMTGNYYFSAKFRDTKADDYYVAGPVLVTSATKEVWIRGRGRRMAFSWATPTAALEELATETDLTDLITTEDGQSILLDGVPLDQTLNLATTWRLGVNEADVIPDGSR